MHDFIDEPATEGLLVPAGQRMHDDWPFLSL
jgi:hypothetical protein